VHGGVGSLLFEQNLNGVYYFGLNSIYVYKFLKFVQGVGPLSHPLTPLSQSHSSDQNRFRSVAIPPHQLPIYMNDDAFSQSKNWFERANVL
jgi:hypothetical protein